MTIHAQQIEALRHVVTRDDVSILGAALWDRAAATPAAMVCRSDSAELSYADVCAAADLIASDIRAAGVTAGQRVAIVMNKGWEQLAATAAILRCGAAYVPIDPCWPAARRNKLILHAEASLILVQASLEATHEWPAGITRVAIDRPRRAIEPSLARIPDVDSDGLAYIIYTSGSTGEPKGVALSHAAALNTILDINRIIGLGPDDRVLAVSNLSFDLSVYDFFGPLLVGAGIVIPATTDLRDSGRLLSVMQRHSVTVWSSVPILMEMLVTQAERMGQRLPDSVRVIMLSGDWIPLGLPARLRKLTNARLISLGGATEAGIWSVIHEITEDFPHWPSVPYGKPLRAQTAYVFDDSLRPLPEGAPGSLYIGGRSLALEYWRDPERTRASFVTHPSTGERLYRTGDRARLRPGRILELLGREDRQIKLLGHRVEPGEVEAVLSRYPGVRAAAVVPVLDEAPARLVAFIQAADTVEDRGGLLSAVKAHVRAQLPPSMVPAEIRVLAELPVSSNSKVDRAALLRLAKSPRNGSEPAQVSARASSVCPVPVGDIA